MKKPISLILTILLLALCTSSLLSCQFTNQPEITFTRVETKGTVYISADCNGYGHSHRGDALYTYGDYAFVVDYKYENYYVIHKSVIRTVSWDYSYSLYAPNNANKEIEEAAINDFLNKDAISYDSGYFTMYIESRSEGRIGYNVIYCSKYTIGE